MKEDINKMRSGVYLPDRVIDAFISRLVGNPHVVVHKATFYEDWAGAKRLAIPNFQALSDSLTERWEHQIHLFPVCQLGVARPMGIGAIPTQMEHFTIGVIDMSRRMTGVLDPLGQQGDAEVKAKTLRGFVLVSYKCANSVVSQIASGTSSTLGSIQCNRAMNTTVYSTP